MNFDYNRLYLTADGRIGRADFWMGILGFFVVGVVVAMIIFVAFGPTSFIGQVLIFIVQLAFAYPAYNLMAKRFQDRGRPGTYAAVAVGVPLAIALLTLVGLTGGPLSPNILGQVLSFINLVVGLWILIDLGIMRGTPGPNEYGPDPVAMMM